MIENQGYIQRSIKKHAFIEIVSNSGKVSTRLKIVQEELRPFN